MPAQALLTAEELLHLNLPNKRTELVRGMLIIREPAGYQHGDIAMRVGAAIHSYVEAEALGRAFAAETGFTLTRGPDTVRAPDVAFIGNARLPHPPPRGFAEMAPDLAVEVLSPDDRPGEVLAKVADWLEAGARLVWVVDPIRANARVYRADGSETLLTEADRLDGEDVVPGFLCDMSYVLRGRA
ncbi:MAG: Uma2 family endonuclease [Gemmatimonadaceae bacterium]